MPHFRFHNLIAVLAIVLLGVALVLLPWQHALLLIVGAVGLLGLLSHPQLALVGLAVSVPFGTLIRFPAGPLSLTATDLLVAALTAAWFARMTAQRRIIVSRPTLLVPLIAFLGAISFSSLASTSLAPAVKEISKWAQVLVVYLFITQCLDQRWARWVIAALILAGSAEALTGIYQFVRRVGPEGFLLFGRFMRAYGHFDQPNPFAGYLGLSLPLAYALSWEAVSSCRKPTPRASNQLGPEATSFILGPRIPACLLGLGLVVSFLLMAAAAVMSWSRGAWVGIAAALTVVTVVRSRSALMLTLAGAIALTYVLAVGGAAYLPPSLLQRVSDFFPYIGGVDVQATQVDDANFAVLERMAHWQAALGMFGDHPWTGVGIGNYAVAYPRYALGRWQDPLGHAHNYYLNVAAETGLVGLLAFLALLASCFVHTLRAVGRSQGYWRAVSLGALGLLVHLATHNLFDNLFVHGMHIQLALLLGLTLTAQGETGTCDAHRD